MPNPSVINSTNVKQFGFNVDFLLEDQKIRFDISGLTVFNTGGAALVQGIYFEVIDPSGVPLAEIDTVDINPSTQVIFDVDLQGGFSQFGRYSIKGILKEANGTEYAVQLFKNIMKPDGFSCGVSKGVFDVSVNCDVPKISFSETTRLAYFGLLPEYKTVNGVLYYPQGTLAQIPFNFAPFQVSGSGKVYTGTYVIKNKTVAAYDLGDSVFVHVSYNASQEFQVNCTPSLCKIICCIDEAYDNYKKCQTPNVSAELKQKLDSIAFPLMIAISKDKCGENAGDEIAEIEKILGCDCGCGNDYKEPVSVSGGSGSSGSFTITGGCATNVEPITSGDTVQYTVTTKAVSMTNQNSDAAFSIKRTESSCGIQFSLSFDYTALSTTILNTIKNNSDLVNIFKTIYSSTANISLDGLDGKGIVNLSTCDYIYQEAVAGRVVNVIGVLIDGATYNAPMNLLLQGDTAIETWLNSLSKGAFRVFYDANTDTTTIISQASSFVVSSITLLAQGGSAYVKMFTKKCNGLREVLQAILNYLSAIDATQIMLGGELALCTIGDDGKPKTVVYEAGSQLFKFMTDQSTAMCKLVDKLSSLAGMTCDSIKSIFPVSSQPIVDADYLLGTKSGACATIPYSDLASVVLKKIFTDSTMKAYICSQIQNCAAPVCSPVDNVTIVVANGDTCISVSSIIGTISQN